MGNAEVSWYERTVKAKVVHYTAGDVSNYTLPLEKGEVHVTQVDGERDFQVTIQHPDARLYVDTDGQGKAKRIDVVLGNVTYIDLNGDGVFDAMIGGKWRLPHILLDGRFVEVANSKVPFCNNEAREVHGNTEYVFEDGKWRVK
jgi:hypothetical protein